MFEQSQSSVFPSLVGATLPTKYNILLAVI